MYNNSIHLQLYDAMQQKTFIIIAVAIIIEIHRSLTYSAYSYAFCYYCLIDPIIFEKASSHSDQDKCFQPETWRIKTYLY